MEVMSESWNRFEAGEARWHAVASFLSRRAASPDDRSHPDHRPAGTKRTSLSGGVRHVGVRAFPPGTQGDRLDDRSLQGRADRRGERNQRHAARRCAILRVGVAIGAGRPPALRLSGWISPPVPRTPRWWRNAARNQRAAPCNHGHGKHGRPPLGRWGPPEPLLWRTAGIRSRAAAPRDLCFCGAPPLLSAP